MNTNKNQIKYSICVPILSEFELIKFQKIRARKIKKIEFLIDSKVKRRKFMIATKRYKIFQNDGQILEYGYKSFVQKARHNWILRIDSDELINTAALEFIEKTKLNANQVIGFNRYQVVEKDGKFFYLKNKEFELKNHVQYRFFNRNFGNFGERFIHSPGFDLSLREIIKAPEECAIYHLDFVFRDYQSRKNKSEKYNELGQITEHQNYQVLSKENWILSQLPDDEINQFLEKNLGLIRSIQEMSKNWVN